MLRSERLKRDALAVRRIVVGGMSWAEAAARAGISYTQLYRRIKGQVDAAKRSLTTERRRESA